MCMKHNMIVAMCRNTRGIGYNNGLPWKYPEELRLFRELTTSHYALSKKCIYDALYMGTNTYYHLPRNLPKRDLYVISRRPENVSFRKEVPFKKAFRSIEECIEHTKYLNYKALWCIGGASIYNTALKNTIFDNIYASEINKNYLCDTYIDDFPKYYLKHIEYESENKIDVGVGVSVNEFKLNVYQLI